MQNVQRTQGIEYFDSINTFKSEEGWGESSSKRKQISLFRRWGSGHYNSGKSWKAMHFLEENHLLSVTFHFWYSITISESFFQYTFLFSRKLFLELLWILPFLGRQLEICLIMCLFFRNSEQNCLGKYLQKHLFTILKIFLIFLSFWTKIPILMSTSI